MARRPVFTPLGTRPYVREVNTEFVFHPGFSLKQKQRSVDSLHRSFLAAYPGARMLEVSGRSPLTLGAELSAFRLMIRQGGAEYPVESAFQASKVFADGGPFTDLLGASPRDAKRDPRLRTSGELVGFGFFSRLSPGAADLLLRLAVRGRPGGASRTGQRAGALHCLHGYRVQPEAIDQLPGVFGGPLPGVAGGRCRGSGPGVGGRFPPGVLRLRSLKTRHNRTSSTRDAGPTGIVSARAGLAVVAD